MSKNKPTMQDVEKSAADKRADKKILDNMKRKADTKKKKDR